MTKTIKEKIEVMEWFEGGGDVEYIEVGYDVWVTAKNPLWNWDDFDYRIKEFQYPMWFRSTDSNMVVRFDDLKSGIVEEGNSVYKKGDYSNNWVSHTDSEYWEEIEEPKEKPNQTTKEIFIVYVTHLNCMELMYAFDTKENAEVKCFELNRQWVNENSFNQYIKDNKITQISLDTYNDYYLEVEDDSYVGINKVVLED